VAKQWMTERPCIANAVFRIVHNLCERRCRSRRIFGGAKNFFPNFLKLARI